MTKIYNFSFQEKYPLDSIIDFLCKNLQFWLLVYFWYGKNTDKFVVYNIFLLCFQNQKYWCIYIFKNNLKGNKIWKKNYYSFYIIYQ